MKKNSNFKNLSYSPFEFISVFIIVIFSTFIASTLNNILFDCSEASVIGVVFLGIISYAVYYFFTNLVFKNEYDFYEVIKKVYPISLQKIIGCIIYIFCLMLIFTLIYNISFGLKATTYLISKTSDISIYFLVGLFLITSKGFNSIFRISGYFLFPLIIYITFLFVFSLFFISYESFLPVLGNGAYNVFFINLKNISVFWPLFFTLFFGGTISKLRKKRTSKNSRINLINFKKIFTFFITSLIALVVMFLGAMPSKLLNTRYSLMFDLSRIISFSTTSLRLTPLMIFAFSIVIFITSSFVLLIGCMSLERLGVIKDYSKTTTISILLLVIPLLTTVSLRTFHNFEGIFNYVLISITFIFPLITSIIYIVKNKFKLNIDSKKKYLNLKEEMQYDR